MQVMIALAFLHIWQARITDTISFRVRTGLQNCDHKFSHSLRLTAAAPCAFFDTTRRSGASLVSCHGLPYNSFLFYGCRGLRAHVRRTR